MNNPNCSKCYASLRLFGDNIVPDDISKLLGVIPNYKVVKGKEVISPSGKQRIAPTGCWILNSEQNKSTDLDEHINWLLDQVSRTEYPVALRHIVGVEKMDIFCYWSSATGQGGPEFLVETLCRLSSMGLKLGLDIYFCEIHEKE